MSGFNGAGQFIISGVGLPYVTATVISSTVANQLNQDLATGLSNCITRDGQSPATANIPMAGFKITGLGNPTATGDALNWGGAGFHSQLSIGAIGTNILDITQNVAGNASAQILNNDAGTGSLARLTAYNGTNSTFMAQLGQGFTTNGILTAGAGLIQATSQLSLVALGNIMRFAAGSTAEAMRIDTSGRITSPTQPRFHTYRSGSGALTASAYNNIAFDQVLYSVGGGLASGVYTAPTSGTYLFTYATPISALTNGVEFENMLVAPPGGATYYSWYTGSTLGWTASGSAAGACAVNMLAGETAFVRVYVGGSCSIMGGNSGPHAFFTGQLIA